MPYKYKVWILVIYIVASWTAAMYAYKTGQTYAQKQLAAIQMEKNYDRD